MKHYLFLLILALAPLRTLPGAEDDHPLRPRPEYAAIASRLARKLPREHLVGYELNDMISQRSWSNYVSALDFDHTYFLKSDIERFRRYELKLDDQLKDGDIGFAYVVFDILKKRVKNRTEYVDTLLKKGFDFERDEVYTWGKDAPWAASEKDWDELWRKKIKSEYLGRLVVRKTGHGKPPSNDPEAFPKLDLSPEEFVRRRYRQYLNVLTDSDAEWVLERYLDAVSQAYDPHTDYMSPTSVEDFQIEMKLSLVGIGALLRNEDGAAQVVRLIKGGPAARDKSKNRLRPGDKIVAVGQGDKPPVDTLHWPLSKTVRLIRGEKGTRVVLVVVPASDPSGTTTKLVTLKRDTVRLEESAAQHKIRTLTRPGGNDLKLGIISLPGFYANMAARSTRSPDYRSASHDVTKLLEQLKREKVHGVVLDLRDNGGGYLPEAIKMAGLFIKDGPVVQVQGSRRRVEVLNDPDSNVVYDGPLVVLVNRASASAAEIVAGALQDHGRALIVGDDRTHGKGTVQAVLELTRDRADGVLKVTSAIYCRITGESTQKRGVQADIVLPSLLSNMEYGESELPNALDWKRVAAASYHPIQDLAAVVPRLRQQSAARQKADPVFTAYLDLLRQSGELATSKQLPLAMNARMKLAKTEKELYDLQRRLTETGETGHGDDTNGKENGPDPVLAETLHILADLVDLKDEIPTAKPGPEPPNRTFGESVIDWLLGR
jgi:carboxyl-terminal processing protease